MVFLSCFVIVPHSGKFRLCRLFDTSVAQKIQNIIEEQRAHTIVDCSVSINSAPKLYEVTCSLLFEVKRKKNPLNSCALVCCFLYFRFHLRSSFLFQIIFMACWICGYYYMIKLHPIRVARTLSYIQIDMTNDTNVASYGYAFVVLNVMLGAFILIFHCIQNDKVSY